MVVRDLPIAQFTDLSGMEFAIGGYALKNATQI